MMTKKSNLVIRKLAASKVKVMKKETESNE